MNYRKLRSALSDLWWMLRLHVWVRWLRLTDPSLWETTHTIRPENIVLSSWRPDQVHVTTNLAGERVEYVHSMWHGAAYFPFLESKVNFTISTANSRPSAEQIEFLRELMAKRESMWKVFQIEIFKHYREYVHRQMDFYDSKGENINDEVAPRIDSPVEMRRLLDTPTLSFDEHAPEHKSFDLTFPCTWEPVGMGITLTLCDWCVVNIH
jgi:Domain of unknown function (DUF6985)